MMSDVAGQVTLSLKEYEELVSRSDWLSCLEQAGVDNWNGFDEATRIWVEQFGEEEDD